MQLRQRDGHWHVVGTVTVQGKSVRVRRSTGLPADRPAEDADAIRRRIENEIVQTEIHGLKPSVPFTQAALDYLRYADPGPTDVGNIRGFARDPSAGFGPKSLAGYFGDTPVAAITTASIAGYVAQCHPSAAPDTVNRYLNTLRAILQFALDMEWLDRLPTIKRPSARREQPDKWLYPDEVQQLIDRAAPHLRPLLVTLACTGCRVSEILYLQISDVILAEGRERIILRDTKNGDRYGVPLHPWAAETLRAHLDGRQEGAVFLTDRGKPYRDREGRAGGQIRNGFSAARDRAADALEAEGKVDRAAVMRRATPHWLRHSFASWLIAEGASILDTARAGHWKTPRLVSDTYGHLAPDSTRNTVNMLPLGRDSRADGKKTDTA